MRSQTASGLSDQAHDIMDNYGFRDAEVGWRTFKEIGGGNCIPMVFEGLTVRPSHHVPEGRIWPKEGRDS